MSQMEFVGGVQAAESEYPDRSIKCVDCGENFIWTGGEQIFFHDKGLRHNQMVASLANKLRTNDSQQSRRRSHREFGSASKYQFNVRSVGNKPLCLSTRPRDVRFIVAPAFWQLETGKTPAKHFLSQVRCLIQFPRLAIFSPRLLHPRALWATLIVLLRRE